MVWSCMRMCVCVCVCVWERDERLCGHAYVCLRVCVCVCGRGMKGCVVMRMCVCMHVCVCVQVMCVRMFFGCFFSHLLCKVLSYLISVFFLLSVCTHSFCALNNFFLFFIFLFLKHCFAKEQPFH